MSAEEKTRAAWKEKLDSLMEKAGEVPGKVHRRTARFLVKRFTALLTEPETGICYINESIPLSPDHIVLSYGRGLFPLVDAGGVTKWNAPLMRGIIPLDERFHLPKNIKKQVNKGEFDIHFDRDFEAIIRGCASRQHTWITSRLMESFIELHQMGMAHSVGAWKDGELVGGLYGLAIGGFFAGESKFFRVSGASDVCFAHLQTHLQERGFLIHDCQRVTTHLARFGALEIPRAEFQHLMVKAVTTPITFYPPEKSTAEAQKSEA